MGVYFKVAKINTVKQEDGTVLSKVEIDSSAPQPTPIMGITKLARDGTANKVSETYINTDGSFTTIWVPIGQDGWKVTIQATLRYRETRTGTLLVDEIGAWLDIDTGQLLFVQTNCCDLQGAVDTTNHKAINKLPDGSLWYIDKITITTKSGISTMADMELVLYRCWETVSES